MLESLGLIRYEMEEETHLNVQIENQLGFYELQLHAIARIESL